jgi:hypothetical protein
MSEDNARCMTEVDLKPILLSRFVFGFTFNVIT